MSTIAIVRRHTTTSSFARDRLRTPNRTNSEEPRTKPHERRGRRGATPRLFVAVLAATRRAKASHERTREGVDAGVPRACGPDPATGTRDRHHCLYRPKGRFARPTELMARRNVRRRTCRKYDGIFVRGDLLRAWPRWGTDAPAPMLVQRRGN